MKKAVDLEADLNKWLAKTECSNWLFVLRGRIARHERALGIGIACTVTIDGNRRSLRIDGFGARGASWARVRVIEAGRE